jgi:hypothetical protein
MEQLRLRTEIDRDFLAGVEGRLTEIYHRRFLEFRDRYRVGRTALALLAVKLLSMAGLAVTIAALLIDRSALGPLPLASGFMLFFLLALVLTWNPHRAEERLTRLLDPYWRWLATTSARGLIKRAIKVAPFAAEYDFRGDLAVYYRTFADKSSMVWRRYIKGWRLSGPGFVLLYKTEKSLHPYGIILHASPDELEAYLEHLGVRACAA